MTSGPLPSIALLAADLLVPRLPTSLLLALYPIDLLVPSSQPSTSIAP